MKKSIKLFIFTFGILCTMTTAFATTPSLMINIGTGKGYHGSVNGLANNVINTEGIANQYGSRKVPIVVVQSSFTHNYEVFANKSAKRTATITASISNPPHAHRLLDWGLDEY